MLRPSYNDLMDAMNCEVEEGEQPVVNSRYSVVIAASKRARQIIAGAAPIVESATNKPLSTAIEELHQGKVKITGEDETADEYVTYDEINAYEVHTDASDEEIEEDEEFDEDAELDLDDEDEESDDDYEEEE